MVTDLQPDKAATGVRQGDLVAIAFFSVEPDGTLLPGELRFFPQDELLTYERVAGLLDAWQGNPSAPFSLTRVRDFAVGALAAEAQRQWNLQAGEQPLTPLTLTEIEELSEADERLDFRSARNLAAALTQVLGAAVYAEAIAEDYPAPTARVREATGRKNEERATQLLMLARKNGYLSKPPTQGKPGGLPTQLAHDLTQRAREALERARAARQGTPPPTTNA